MLGEVVEFRLPSPDEHISSHLQIGLEEPSVVSARDREVADDVQRMSANMAPGLEMEDLGHLDLGKHTESALPDSRLSRDDIEHLREQDAI